MNRYLLKEDILMANKHMKRCSKLYVSDLQIKIVRYRHTPWRRKWQPTPVLLLGKSHGWRNLVGYSPWGCKESDVTESLHFQFSLTVHLLDYLKAWSHQMLVKMWNDRNSYLLLVGMQNGTDTLEDSLKFLTKLSIDLPYNPEMVFLAIHLNELKT